MTWVWFCVGSGCSSTYDMGVVLCRFRLFKYICHGCGFVWVQVCIRDAGSQDSHPGDTQPPHPEGCQSHCRAARGKVPGSKLPTPFGPYGTR